MHASTMSQRQNLDAKYIDTKYSSGDSKNVKSKQYQEENNNEVDELSKELSEMGCIVDTVKRPPNICVENYVYESETEKSEGGVEDAYSDEFEDDNSEDDSVETVNNELKVITSSETVSDDTIKSAIKLSKSQSSMSCKKRAPSVSTSGRSTSFGSLSIPPTRRVNMSFTNERLREIQRHNNILLTKILGARNTKKSSIPPHQEMCSRPIPSAAVTRKHKQKQIDHDNMNQKDNKTSTIVSPLNEALSRLSQREQQNSWLERVCL